MKVCLGVAASAVISGALASSASASFIYYEGFNYSTGALLGDANSSSGTSWLRAGVSAGPTAIQVVSGSLTDPIDTSVGNSVALTGIGDNSGSALRLAIAPVGVTSGTVYYSFMMRGDALTGSNNTIGGFFIGLNNTGNTSQTTNPATVGAKVQARIDPVDATKYDIGIFNNLTATSTATSWAPAMSLSDTHLVICAYTFNPSTGDDVSQMWIDPDSSTFGAASAPVTGVLTSTGGTDLGSVSSLILRQGPSPFMTLDEIRMGTTWSDVTSPVPTPEPASMSLLALSAAALLRRRARVQA